MTEGTKVFTEKDKSIEPGIDIRESQLGLATEQSWTSSQISLSVRLRTIVPALSNILDG